MQFHLDGSITSRITDGNGSWRVYAAENCIKLEIIGHGELRGVLLHEGNDRWRGVENSEIGSQIQVWPVPWTEHKLNPPKEAKVEVVVINYRRPANVARILRALREQSELVRVTLVDASIEGRPLTEPDSLLADRVFKLSKNYGGFNRYLAADRFDCSYTFFIDDDILPGRSAVKSFLQWAEGHRDFGVLGQNGRVLRNNTYTFKPVRAQMHLREVDFVVMGYFVRRQVLDALFAWKEYLGLAELREDDFLLCSAAHWVGLKVGVTPCATVEEKMDFEVLPEPFALGKQKDHLTQRRSFIHMLQRHQWKSMEVKRRDHASAFQ